MDATPPLTRDPSPSKPSSLSHRRNFGHATQAVADWEKLHQLKTGSICVIDGNSVDIADIFGVAKYGAGAEISSDPEIRTQIDQSIQTLNRHLRNGHLVYGVTTGYGGSADTRPTDTAALQRALVQHQNAGVLTSADVGLEKPSTLANHLAVFDDFDTDFDVQSMPTSWVRASMLTRCNSLIRGHSGVRMVVAENILALLRYEITPVVPLRGSISASGDLSPLSYIAGAIEGNPDIYCRVGRGRGRIVTADKALKEFKIEPVVLLAKEGLGLLNGTAFSAATASLALYQSQQIAVLSQILTAMGTEALQGTAESFWPRIAEMRPHPGQIEAAANIHSCLSQSKLATCVDMAKETKIAGLYQDRYALRTASQWIGPQLEDLQHAHEQLLVEINSTTDNPLIDVDSDQILHGGNFQAAVVTSTMDRTRLVLNKFGRMLFAQAGEMINPATNRGLPANLVSDDPSLSYTCKGVDINMAAYSSELSFLANPVGSHVNSAEMHNQALNSLALVSSRYTFQALDTIRILCAAYLFTVCQALDLRVQYQEFLRQIQPSLFAHISTYFPELSIDTNTLLKETLWTKFTETWSHTNTLDLPDRCTKTFESLIPILVRHLASSGSNTSAALTSLMAFTTTGSPFLASTYKSIQATLESDRLTLIPNHLCLASKALYTYVRSPSGLNVPFHKGLCEHPSGPKPEGWTDEDTVARRTIGSRISVIYEALRDGRVDDVVMRLVKDIRGL